MDMPSPICPDCGVLTADEYKEDGEYIEDGMPFPIFCCLKCGSNEVEWE